MVPPKKRPQTEANKQSSDDHPKINRKRARCSWEESFSKLQEFKKKFGHCNVPSRYPADVPLGRYVEKIRGGKYTPEQYERLVALGFDWESKDERIRRQWNEKYERLRTFYLLYGHCRIPGKTKNPTLIPWTAELGIWVGRQRTYYNKGRLQQYQIKQLSAIQFEFRVQQPSPPSDGPPKPPDAYTLKRDSIWMDNYRKLQEFRRIHNHCLVTKTHLDQVLFAWVKKQRELFRQNDLRADRIELLDQIEFTWVTSSHASHNQLQWDCMYQQLVDFRTEHAHILSKQLPITLKRWLSRQKSCWRNGQLSHDRIARLEQVGVEKSEETGSTKDSITSLPPVVVETMIV